MQIHHPAKQVGGWIIVLIIWFAFWVTNNNNATLQEISTFHNQYSDTIDKSVPLQIGYSFYYYSLWMCSITSVYCAFVLGFKKKRAVGIARCGLILILILCIIRVFIILIPALVLHLMTVPMFINLLPTFFLMPAMVIAWFYYLRKSVRVRDTYAH